MFQINNMTQMSCNFKEQSKIVRTGGIHLWGRGASRCQPKPPPTTPRSDSAAFTRGENAISRRGIGTRARNQDTGAESGHGRGIRTQIRNSDTVLKNGEK